MRVFVAGGTGVIGQFLVPGLIAAGHEVTATTRSPAKADQLKQEVYGRYDCILAM